MRADVVLRIRPGAYATSFTLLAADFLQATEQLKQWYDSIANVGELPQKPGDTP